MLDRSLVCRLCLNQLTFEFDASHCFSIEKAGRQNFKHTIARPSINRDIKNRKTMRGTRHIFSYPGDCTIWNQETVRRIADQSLQIRVSTGIYR